MEKNNEKMICLVLALVMLLTSFGATYADYWYETEYNEFGFPVRDTYEKDAEYEAGMKARSKDENKRKKDRTALEHFRNSANDGYACGQYEYANCLENGWGTDKDYKRCFEYYYYSAMQGHKLGQAALGGVTCGGHGVGADDDMAFYYFMLSADQGSDLGQLWAGYCYQKGIGVKKDYDMARYYYRLSADQGNKSAKKRLKELS